MFESFIPELIINQPSFYSYVHLYPYILVVKISITNLLTIKWLVIIIKEPGCRRQPPLRWKVDCRHRQKNCWVWKWDYHSLFFTGLSSCFPLNCNFLGIPWYGKKHFQTHCASQPSWRMDNSSSALVMISSEKCRQLVFHVPKSENVTLCGAPLS
jgi:hypothetical protein